MRIVVSSGSRTWGGLEAMAEVIARGLHRRGHHVVLFCREGSPLHERLRSELPCEPVLRGERLDPLTLGRCVAALRRHRVEVVIGNTMKDPGWTGAAARLLGIPVVYRHELNVPYPQRRLDRLLFGRVPSRHVVNSEATRRTLLASAAWLDPARVVVIPNGVDVDAIRRASPAELGIGPGEIVFGFVGRWEEAKGIRELADAWREVVAALPRAHLAIAGWGPMEAEFRTLLGGVPNVRWLGFRTDVASLMKSFDVLVLPSHAEGFGLVLVEAMAAGRPVVATDTSSIPEIVTDGIHGRLVPPRDAPSLARAMIRLAEDPESRARMGERAAERALERFPVERMLDRHESLLHELAGPRRTGSP